MADLPQLAAIERDGVASLIAAAAVPAAIDDGSTLPEAVLRTALADGLLFVARDDGAPVGFVAAELTGDGLHILELDVMRTHQRRGIGRALVERCLAAGRARAAPAALLTTDRLAPFNAPFYARVGFAIVPEDEAPEPLRRALADERAAGLDPARRVAMVLPLSYRMRSPG